MIDPRTAPIEEITRRYAGLTIRQRQVADLIYAGMSAKEMGRALSISPRTIELHVKWAYETLGIRRGAAHMAILVYRVKEHQK